MKTDPKNDGVLKFLQAVFKKDNRDADEITYLSAALTLLASDVELLSKSLDSIIKAVQQQNKVISDLYVVQDYLIRKIGATELLGELEKDLSQTVSDPDAKNQKNNKPN